jgi:S-adenosyl-L-methionine hydrolase (adenosine-forming)
MANGRTVVFLSDFGYRNEWVGICHAVMNRISPTSPIVDLSHGVPPLDVRGGAVLLADSLPYLSADAILLAIVDPSVGRDRDVALESNDGRLVVGPDNGLLALAVERFGGAVEAVDVARSPHRLEPTSATFHGRDLFAPVAAHLAAGAPLGAAGDPIDVEELTPLHTPRARRNDDGGLVAHALAFDRFGNVMLDIEHDELAGSGLKLGHLVTVNEELAHYATTFADVPPGELLLYEDAYRTLALAVNRGSAALHLGLDLDAEVHIRPA